MMKDASFENHPRWNQDLCVEEDLVGFQWNVTLSIKTELHTVCRAFNYLACIEHNQIVSLEAGSHGKLTNICLIDYSKS